MDLYSIWLLCRLRITLHTVSFCAVYMLRSTNPKPFLAWPDLKVCYRALFVIKIIDTYSNRSPESALESGAQEKRIYNYAVEYCKGTFTPLVTSLDGHREAELFPKRMAMCIALKWPEGEMEEWPGF